MDGDDVSEKDLFARECNTSLSDCLSRNEEVLTVEPRDILDRARTGLALHASYPEPA
jgi:hypothetical protein